ncbi:MAG: response regulator, partial [Planctomycetaceae bacterium]|nr:response regulator [Planctomycetaceae bacterium]
EDLTGTKSLLEETELVSGVGGWELNLADREVRWTKQTSRIHEVSPDYQPSLQDAISFYAPESQKVISAAVEAGIREARPWDLELPFVTAAGHRRWVRAKGKVSFRDEEPVRLFGTFQDITSHRLAERCADHSRRILKHIAVGEPLSVTLSAVCRAVQAILDQSVVAVLSCENEVIRSIEAASPSSHSALLRNLIGCHLSVCESFTVHSSASFEQTAESLGTLSRQEKAVAACAGLMPCHIWYIRDRKEAPVGILFAGIDGSPAEVTAESVSAISDFGSLAGIAITRFREEARLKRSESMLRESQSRAKLGYWQLELPSEKLTVTDEIFRILRYPPDHKPSVESFMQTRLHPEDHDRIVKAREMILAAPGVVPAMDIRILVPDGDVRWVHIEGTVTGGDGHVWIHGTLQDIHDRKQADIEREELQAQLQQSQKIESIGRLAGGIAHDYNNMLAVILAHCELAGAAGIPDSLQEHIEAIEQAARRSADLTRQLLIFARRQTATPVILNLSQSVRSLLQMLQRLIGEHISLEYRPCDFPVFVKIDPVQMDQIVTNLVVNARDAISGQGAIMIRTDLQSTVRDAVDPDVVPVRESFVVLEVEDNGSGMTEEVMSHLFEPFFTTKPVGLGTGLGLATVFGIVRQNGGFIRVDGRPSAGAVFRIFLPEHQNSETVARRPSIPTSPRVCRGKVLLVEDEPDLVRVTAIFLKKLGLDTVVAGNPLQAVQIFDSLNGDIDLLVTDVVMPQRSGWDLAAELRRKKPNLGCVFISGYSAGTHPVESPAVGNSVFLQKPFSLDDLATAVGHAQEACTETSV